MTKKDVLIRGVDDSIFRRAKATAASNGITLGTAVNEALANWAKETENIELESKYCANLEFVRGNWNRIRSYKGKAVVVADGGLQRVFPI